MLIIQSEDYTGKIPEESVAFSGEKGVWFRIQIAASGKPIPLDKEHFKGVENVSEYPNRGMFKYTVGKEATFEQANKVMLPVIRARGFTEAFIVAFKDGRRIPVSEALKLLEGK
jgi:N-acetylmuramoyl-L-alanine amidase